MQENISIETFKNKMEKYLVNFIPSNQITINKEIGEGGFGKVYLATYINQKVAVKKLKNEMNKGFVNEIKILSKVHHPCIPRLYGYSLINQKICFVIDYIDGQTLNTFLRQNKISKTEKLDIISKIADIIEFLNFNNIIHRDLKTENIMIKLNHSNQIKQFTLFLIDFGISLLSKKFKKIDTTPQGTYHYMAPENFTQFNDDEDENSDIKITNKADIWSFGCIVSEVFSNVKPWANYSFEQIFSSFNSRKVFPIPNVIKDKFLIHFIQRCTEYNIKDRYDIIKIKESLIYMKKFYLDNFKFENDITSLVVEFKKSNSYK
jgi:serine/threonine protein kinase